MATAKVGLLFIALLALSMLALTACAMSPNEAVTYVSKTNNFLLDTESAAIVAPQVMISYSGKDYWVVSGLIDSNPSIYVPVSNSTQTVASGAIEARELIKTEIVLTRINAQRSSFPVGDWPFSYATKTMFYDLESKFGDMSPMVTSVATDLTGASGTNAKALASTATNLATEIGQFATLCKSLGDDVETARLFEEKFLTDPDTNKTNKLESYYTSYFDSVDSFISTYNDLTSSVTSLRKSIAELSTTELDSTKRNSMLSSLTMPSSAAKIPSFSSNTQQIRTIIEGIFNASNGVEPLVANLNTRILRNVAWNTLYGTDAKITAANPSFNSLSDAAEGILSTDNVDLWKEQATVDELKINWQQAKSRYTSGEYEKASSFAKKAETNAIAILEGGAKDTTSGISQDLVVQIIVGLVVLIAVMFLFDKMYWQKRKAKGNEEEDYEQN